MKEDGKFITDNALEVSRRYLLSFLAIEKIREWAESSPSSGAWVNFSSWSGERNYFTVGAKQISQPPKRYSLYKHGIIVVEANGRMRFS